MQQNRRLKERKKNKQRLEKFVQKRDTASGEKKIYTKMFFGLNTFIAIISGEVCVCVLTQTKQGIFRGYLLVRACFSGNQR